MYKEIMKFVRQVRKLSNEDKTRLLECIHCPFHEECTETVEKPEDNEDGSCKTKQQFIQKLKGCDNND